MKTPLNSFKIIKEMYEHFVKTYRELEPKLMICEKEDFDNIENALKDYEMEHTLRIRLENANYELVRKNQENEKKLEAIKHLEEEQGIYLKELEMKILSNKEQNKLIEKIMELNPLIANSNVDLEVFDLLGDIMCSALDMRHTIRVKDALIEELKNKGTKE